MKLITPERVFTLEEEFRTSYLYPNEAYILDSYINSNKPVTYIDQYGQEYKAIIKSISSIDALNFCNFFIGDCKYELNMILIDNSWLENGF